VSMAMTLKECEVDSVPLNILIPSAGTPLTHAGRPAVVEILKAIALFRLILKGGSIRLAAGREAVLGDFLGMAFMAGADGLMIGGYLTRKGRPPEDDLTFVRDMKEIWTA
ncbi:MAG: biotin synthase BioB, partial [Desulfobulbaceae bacterium]|nr:biotin synthase BioB [Desulfobulbaceae bacterium]